jgi:hypothetical protein
VKPHADADELDERRHESDLLGQILLSSMVHRGIDKPVMVEVRLKQGYREVGPLVYLEQGDKNTTTYTVEEVGQLANALLEVVWAAAGEDDEG